MRVFHIKGFSGLMMFLVAILGVLSLTVFLPTAFIMVLWNATVFEGLSGPQINLGQALLLWMATFIMLVILLQPQVQLQFKRVSSPADLDPKRLTPSDRDE